MPIDLRKLGKHFGDATFGDTTHDSVDAERLNTEVGLVSDSSFYHALDESEGGRDLMTTEQIDIYVDPTGDDNNEGTSNSPIATLTEAMYRLPTFIQHQTTIHLADGTYDSETGYDGTGGLRTQFHTINSPADFKIEGNTTTPSNVHVDLDASGGGMWNFGVFGLAPHRTSVEGIKITGTLSLYKARMTFRDCIIDGTGTSPRSQAVGGYGQETIFTNCTFQNFDYVFQANRLGNLYAVGCDGSVSTAFAQQQRGSNIYIDTATKTDTDYPTLREYSGSRLIPPAMENVVINDDDLSLGSGSYAERGTSTAIGHDAKANSSRSVAVGYDAATAQNGRNVALGSESKANSTRSVAIGDGAVTNQNDEAVIACNMLRHGAQKGTLGAGDLDNSEVSLQIDETAGELQALVKQSDGTTSEVTLGTL